MSLRYWHKLAILISLVALGGVVLTASYAHVLSRQAMARGDDDERALAQALLAGASELIGGAMPARAQSGASVPAVAQAATADEDQLKATAERVLGAMFSGEVRAESQIERVTVWRIDAKKLVPVYVHSQASTSTPDVKPPPAEPLPADLQEHLLTIVPKPGKPMARREEDDFRTRVGPALYRPVLDGDGQFVAWIVAELAGEHESRLESARSSLVTFAITLSCGLLLVSAAAAWMFGRRMRELGAAMARVGDGHSDVYLDDESHDEMGDIARAANRTARTLRETHDLRKSMRLAEQVQRALLPADPPKLPGLQIAHFCDYCDEVGGDYIDYIPVGDGEQPDGWAVVVGDGTGHGVGAALLMATARSVLRTHPLRFSELAQSVGLINRRICEQVPDGKFVTLFMLVFSADAKRICWLSAGHDEAILLDPLSTEFAELRGSDVPLGVEASWEFTHHTRQSPLARGTVIVIGTDGIWEMRNAGEQMFGKDRLKRIMRRAASESAAEIGKQILEALHQHRGEMPPQDDVTFIVIKVDG